MSFDLERWLFASLDFLAKYSWDFADRFFKMVTWALLTGAVLTISQRAGAHPWLVLVMAATWFAALVGTARALHVALEAALLQSVKAGIQKPTKTLRDYLSIGFSFLVMASLVALMLGAMRLGMEAFIFLSIPR